MLILLCSRSVVCTSLQGSDKLLEVFIILLLLLFIIYNNLVISALFSVYRWLAPTPALMVWVYFAGNSGILLVSSKDTIAFS